MQAIPRVVLVSLFVALVLALALTAVAQVTVTNQGYAEQSGPAVPAMPASPPILYAPSVHLNNGATTDNTGVNSPAAAESLTQGTLDAGDRLPFNFGIAQFGGYSNSGVGQEINGRSLGDIARELRERNGQRNGAANAKTYTNSDIESLKQGGTATGSVAQGNGADNWDPNNGVITPDNGQAAPNSVAAPAEQAAPNPPVASPFAPRSQSYNSTPYSSPTMFGKPSAQRPYATHGEFARYDEPTSPAAHESSANTAPPADETNQLPKTASKLPLFAVAGLFSVTVGMFVRSQRAKA